MFPVPSLFVTVPPFTKLCVNVFSAGATVLCVHWYFKLALFISVPRAGVTVTVVFCVFAYVVFPFVPKLIVGAFLIISVTTNGFDIIILDGTFPSLSFTLTHK